VQALRAHRGKVVLAITLAGILFTWFSTREAGNSPTVRPDIPDRGPAKSRVDASPPVFDFYLLALTAHAAFCADGRERLGECRLGARRPLVIHGLWPERYEPRTWPHDCPGPRLALDPGLEIELRDFMPGMAAGLHEHEWREHGGCSGLDDDVYFRSTLELARVLDAALGAQLTTLAGEETDAARLREVAEQFQPGIGATFTLHCRTIRGEAGRPVLVEVRQCVDNDGPGGAPGTLLDCGKVRRRDQGCGKSFLVLGARR
jgi:ribonuclease I